MKKLLSVMLIFALLLSMAPVSMADSGVGSLEITKVFEMPEGVTTPDAAVFKLRHDNGLGNDATEFTAIATSETSWIALFENVTALGGYDLIEEELGECWENDFEDTKIKINKDETLEITVTNTYTCDPPVTTLGSITFVKEWEGDFVPESGYVNFTVNDEYPFATVEYPSWTTIVEDLPFGTYNLTKEWVYETGNQTYYNVSGIPQTVELTETTPDATFTVVNHMNPPTGDVMFEKVWIDDPPLGLTTVSSVWTPYGSEEGTTISMFENTSWTAGPVTQKVGDYTVEEITLLPGWTSEIEYKIGEGSWMDYDEYVTVPADGTLYIRFINEYGKGDVMFEKVWIDDPPEGLTTVSSVWTPYESQDGTTISMFENTSWTAGPVTQPVGKYTVEEIELLPGWTSEIEYKVGEGSWMDYDEYVTVPKDDTLYIRFINEYGKGDVMFEKVWIDDPPEGLTTVSSVWTPYGSEEGTTISMFENTSWTAGPVTQPVGKYTVEEIELLPGWTSEIEYKIGEGSWMDYDEYVTVPADGTLYIRFINEYGTGDVMFEKVWLDDPPEGLTTVSSVWMPVGSTDGTTISMFESTSWTAGPVTQPVGDYEVEEITLLPGWTSEIEYKVGEGDWMDYGEYVTVPKDGTLYIRFLNDYEESPTGMVEVQKLFEGVDVLEGFEDMEFRIQFTLRFPDGETVNTITDTYTGSEWLATPRYFNGIPVGSGYAVEETIFEMTTPVSGNWTESVTPTSFEVKAGETTPVEVTNTYNGVEISKSVSPSSHNRGGGPVTYTVTFENTGTVTYDAFWIQDQADWFVPEDAFDFTW